MANYVATAVFDDVKRVEIRVKDLESNFGEQFLLFESDRSAVQFFNAIRLGLLQAKIIPALHPIKETINRADDAELKAIKEHLKDLQEVIAFLLANK